MISSILAFAAGLAAKIKLQPDSNPETAGKSDLDLATLFAVDRVEAELAASRQASSAMSIEIDALRDRNAILERQRDELADHLGIILTRERRSQDRHAVEINRLVNMMPMPPALYPVPTPAPQSLMSPEVDEYIRSGSLLDPGHSHRVAPGGAYVVPGAVIMAHPDGVAVLQSGQMLAQQALNPPRDALAPTPFGPLPTDHEWWQTHPETAFRYFDCTCVPGRADAFRNQQANAAR
jgi:hypothetical protein